MQSKNKKAPTVAESRHIDVLKLMPCSVCDESGPCDVHEVKQGQWFTSIPLCKSCHQGPLLGLHGQKRAWLQRKMAEVDALAVTIRRLVEKMGAA